MRTGWRAGLLGLLMLGVVVTAAVAPAGGSPAEAATAAERARVLQLVNAERAARGLPLLVESAELTSAAEDFAAYMARANFFSHVGPNGSSLVSRAEAAGYKPWTWLAENIAAGYTTPEAVFQGWMNSDGHRANILSAQAREIGIGHAYTSTSTYQHYWTMELGARPNLPVQPVPTAAPTAQPTPTPKSYPVPARGKWRTSVPLAARGS